MGNDEILIETSFRTFRVRVDRFGKTPLSEAQRDDGRRLASELRFALGFDPDLQVAAQRLQHALLDAGPVRLRRADSKLETQRFFEQLRDFLEEQLETGRLVVLEEPAIANVPEQELTTRPERPEVELPAQLSVSRNLALETLFEVRFVDEVGQAISGIEVEIAAGDRVERTTTNAAGVALLEGTTAGSGTAIVVDPRALEQILAPRWAIERPGNPPKGMNTTERLFDGQDLGALRIKGGVPNTIIIMPKPGDLIFQLVDQDGAPVPDREFCVTLVGGDEHRGTTDAGGFGRVSDVPLIGQAKVRFLDFDKRDFTQPNV